MTEADSGADEYRVAVYSPIPDPPGFIELFQRELQLTRTDAQIWTHRLPGVLTPHFSAAQAEQLVQAIGQIGARGAAIRAVDVPDPQRATVIHHARCADSGLEIIQLKEDHNFTVPWSEVELICVGEVPLDASRHFSSGKWVAVTAGHHYQSPGVTVPATPSFEAWIVCRPPHPMLCFDQGRMNYEYLGSRLSESAAQNFKQFISDLTTHASHAGLTESTLAYLEHVEPERYRFPARDDLWRYVTLNVLMHRQRPAPSAEASQANG